VYVVQSVSSSSQCVRPCKCPDDAPRCKTSHTIKDGCGCCYICPRQQGDLCDHRDKCDEDRGLHCDFMLDDGHRGICRGLNVSLSLTSHCIAVYNKALNALHRHCGHISVKTIITAKVYFGSADSNQSIYTQFYQSILVQ